MNDSDNIQVDYEYTRGNLHELIEKGKESLDLARLKFGDSDLWNVKSNDGIAEAALLTLYWIEKFNS